MGWVIAIICIILVVIFWRIFLPLGVIAAVVIALAFLYFKAQSDRDDEKRLQAERETQERIARAHAAVQQKIAKSQRNGASVEREWEVATEADPASGAQVPRVARVLSDDGLCRLQVEQRLNATRLAGVYCPGLKVATGSDVEVKFDNRPTSDKMRLERFSNSADAYIPSQQPTYGGLLSYDEFLLRMTTAKKVALLLNIEGAGEHWFAFSLEGSRPALIKIGAITPRSGTTHDTIQRAPPGTESRSDTKSARPRQSPQYASPPSLPANAKLNIYGNDWECQRGYRRSANECVAVQLPPNAKLNIYGNDWECQRGFRRSANECLAVQLPPNAKLNIYGNDWDCQRGFRRSANQCVAVQLPPNAKLNIYGNDWECQRGFRRSANECVAVQLPANAKLNIYGNDWECVRGYRRSGPECVPVGVVSN